MFYYRIAAAACVVAFAAACGDGNKKTVSQDLASPPDAVNGSGDVDLMTLTDLAVLDLAVADLAEPDLGVADLAITSDQSGATADLTPLVDLVSSDLTPLVCATGTADCDDDPSDCETNILTNAAHCGRCDHVCGGNATCVAGGCGATLVLDPSGQSNFCSVPVFSADQLFAISCWGSASEVRKASLTVGSDITGAQLVAYPSIPVTAVRGITLDSQYVYFGVQGTPGTVFRYPVGTTGVAMTEFSSENDVRFDSLQLIGDTFYWLDNRHTSESQIGTGTLRKRSKTDTSDTQIVTGMGKAYELIVADTKFLWRETRTDASQFAIYQVPLSGGLANTVLVDTLADAVQANLIRQGNYAYWTINLGAPNGKIRRLDLTNDAAVAEDLVVNLTNPTGLVADANYLYFVSGSVLYRVRIDGTAAPEKLSQTLSAPWLFHVDATYVYLATGIGPGMSVARVAK